MEATTDKFLTTGQVALHCGVNFRTVIRWIQRGHLKAQRLPGRGDHRVEASEFVKFLSKHQMTIPPSYESLLQSQHRIRALIVDDDAHTARGIERLLKQRGFETDRASDGFEAGVKLTTYKPVLMTLDLKMKGMNGFEVLRSIRENKNFADLRILVISGDTEENLKRSIKEGAHDALAKPFTADELSAKISALLGIHQQEVAI